MKLRHYRPEDAGALALIMRRSIESLGPRHYATEQVAAWAAAAPDASEMALRLGDGRTVLVAEAVVAGTVPDLTSEVRADVARRMGAVAHASR